MYVHFVMFVRTCQAVCYIQQIVQYFWKQAYLLSNIRTSQAHKQVTFSVIYTKKVTICVFAGGLCAGHTILVGHMSVAKMSNYCFKLFIVIFGENLQC